MPALLVEIIVQLDISNVIYGDHALKYSGSN